MKSAPLVAGSALGLLLLAFATAQPVAPLQKTVPLDFTGIDTIEVLGGSPHIRITSRQAPQASYEDERGTPFDVRRTGSRLVIDVRSKGYRGVEFSVPASVHAMDLQGADIVAVERLQSMQVTSSDAIQWRGDIARLDLRDSADHSKERDDDPDEPCDCIGTGFTVSNGHIAELLVRSKHARLRLSHPDTIDAVHAWLGEKGGVSLENARRFDNIHVVSSEAQLPDAAGPEPAKGP